MGFIDKLKNVFFEEVDEEEEEVKSEPLKLAKKIEFPKRKERVIEKKEAIDEDFFSDEKSVEVSEEEKDVQNDEVVDNSFEEEVGGNKIPMMFEEEDFFDNTFKEEIKEEVKPLTREERGEKRELYQGKREPTYVESVSKTTAYTYTKSYYDNKETKGFKPSPIISPIYGVLDKNYRKEEVVAKKEVKGSSNSYRKVDLDTVRKKAFGSDEVKEEPKKEGAKEVKVEKKKEEKTLYDVNLSKPDVDKITLAEADEYYNDLGLAYNVDYTDASREQATTRTKKYHEDKQEENEGNDNLFDLIDLMYNKED